MHVAFVKKYRFTRFLVYFIAGILSAACSLEITFPETVPPIRRGSLELVVTWPEDVTPSVDGALVTIDDVAVTSDHVALEAHRLILTTEIDPGTHAVGIVVRSGDQDRTTIHIEVIVPDEDPVYQSVALTHADFTEAPPEDPPPEDPPPEDPPQEDGSVAVEVTVDLPQDESITFDVQQDIEVLSSQSLTVAIAEPFDSYAWRLDGQVISGASGSSVTISCAELAPGIHRLTAIVEKNGRLFSKTTRFRVIN